MKSHLRNTLSFVIGWPISLLALFFIIRLILPHLGEIRSQLATLNYWMLLTGGVCFLVYYFLRSLIYQKILTFLGYSLSLRESAFYWGQSELQRYIPGSIWSFLGRSVLFSRKQVEKKDIATSLIIESQLVLIGTCLVTLLGISFLIQAFIQHIPFRTFILPLTALCVFSLTLFYIYSGQFAGKIKRKLLSRIIISPLQPIQNFSLLFLSITGYLFFGLGYFFVMGSIFPINPQLIWSLVGLFVFSLLAGYLSILPTGLGIREGILILGLKSIATPAIVGVASIVTRLILIISEIFYLFLTFLWHRTKNDRIIRIESYVSSNKQQVLLTIGIVLYSIYFIIVSFLRYDNFYTGRFDLGNMAQTVWNSYHGNIFGITDPNGVENVSRLAFHADFLLVLLAPFYFLWENPKMLLLLQTIIVALGAFFVFGIAQKDLKSKNIPLILAFLYLLSPGVERTTIYDFHAVTLATTFLLGAFYFLQKRKKVWFVVFLFLAAMTKEQIWIIVAFFGIYDLIRYKDRVLGTSLFLLGIGMTAFLISFAIPHSAGSQHFALAYYSDYGDKPSTVIKNIVFSPQKTLPLLIQPDRVRYFNQLVGPVGFLSLLAPFYLLFATAEAGISILSSNPQLREIYYQYSAAITPFVFIAAIFGIQRLRKFFPGLPGLAIGLYLVCIGIYTAYLYGPLPGSKEPNLAVFTRPQPSAKKIESYLQALPNSYSISASNNLGSHLSHRSKIYTLPNGIDTADVITVLRDKNSNPNDDTGKLISRLKNDQNYIVFYDFDGFILFKRIQGGEK